MFNLVILAFPVDYRWCSTDCSKIQQYRVNMEYIESTIKQKNSQEMARVSNIANKQQTGQKGQKLVDTNTNS